MKNTNRKEQEERERENKKPGKVAFHRQRLDMLNEFVPVNFAWQSKFI